MLEKAATIGSSNGAVAGNEGAALGLSLSSGSVAGTEISEYIKNLK